MPNNIDINNVIEKNNEESKDRAERIKKSNIKTTIIKGIIGLVLFLGVFIFYKYGWRYMGFQMTTDPAYITVYSTGENTADNSVWVTGISPMNIGSYAGAVTKVDEESGTLYIGIRFNLSGKDTEFRVIYPQDKVKINKIVLKKNEIERVIWERGKDNP